MLTALPHPQDSMAQCGEVYAETLVPLVGKENPGGQPAPSTLWVTLWEPLFGFHTMRTAGVSVGPRHWESHCDGEGELERGLIKWDWKVHSTADRAVTQLLLWAWANLALEPVKPFFWGSESDISATHQVPWWECAHNLVFQMSKTTGWNCYLGMNIICQDPCAGCKPISLHLQWAWRYVNRNFPNWKTKNIVTSQTEKQRQKRMKINGIDYVRSMR